MEFKYKYDVVFSFAGEDRDFVEKIVKNLRNSGVEFFYDEDRLLELWGKDLSTELDNVYQFEARFCVIVISKSYKEKLWTNHELKSALARAIKDREKTYILPIRLDDTQIPGIRHSTHFLDGKKNSPQKLAEMILKKIQQNSAASIIAGDDEGLIPIVRRKIKDQEKKEFLLSSYDLIKDFFKSNLERFRAKNPHTKTKFKEKSKSKFIATIQTEEYEYGCKIWIDKSGFNDFSILYYENYDEEYESGAYNDCATVSDDGKEIFFEIVRRFFGRNRFDDIDLKHASMLDTAKYFWGILIMNVEE